MWNEANAKDVLNAGLVRRACWRACWRGNFERQFDRRLGKFLKASGWSRTADGYRNDSNGLTAECRTSAALKQIDWNKEKDAGELAEARKMLLAGGWTELSEDVWSKPNWKHGHDAAGDCVRTMRQAWKIQYPISAGSEE